VHADPEVAIVVLLRDDGAALLQHRDDIPGLPHAGLWTPPGGHREPGESPEACARREFFEETDYRCGELHHLATFWDDHVAVGESWVTVYWARYAGGPVICREGQDLQFVRGDAGGRYPIPAYLIELWDAARAAAVEAGVVGG
jgi:8-oxo-dGTP pyrophosphatase MutT (NUDIX family)